MLMVRRVVNGGHTHLFRPSLVMFMLPLSTRGCWLMLSTTWLLLSLFSNFFLVAFSFVVYLQISIQGVRDFLAPIFALVLFMPRLIHFGTNFPATNLSRENLKVNNLGVIVGMDCWK